MTVVAAALLLLLFWVHASDPAGLVTGEVGDGG